MEGGGEGHSCGGRAGVPDRAPLEPAPPHLLLLEHVDLGEELLVRLDAPRLAEHLATRYILALQAAEQHADVVPGLALVQGLLEHLNARACRLDGDGATRGADLEAAHLELVTHLGEVGRAARWRGGAWVLARSRPHLDDARLHAASDDRPAA